ncbi:protein of unknown function [Streptomyces sp. KY75]|nr:protein of unknown function [Streptomyces sp. KY70]CAD5975092.1 protein of unknown function [Streptomyces sp. KY75]
MIVVYDAVDHECLPCTVTEYGPAVTLGGALRSRGPWSPPRTSDLCHASRRGPVPAGHRLPTPAA